MKKIIAITILGFTINVNAQIASVEKTFFGIQPEKKLLRIAGIIYQ